MLHSFRVTAMLVLLMLFCYLPSIAQEEPPLPDTVIVNTEEPPAEEVGVSEGNLEDSVAESQYFLRRLPEPDTLLRRNLEDSTIANYKKDAEFWYANKSFRDKDGKNDYKKKEDSTRPYKPVSQRPWFQTLLWLVIIGGFATFVILYLANSNVSLFRKTGKQIDEDTEEGDTDDIFAINYQREIEKAANASNYRLAIRLMFLRLLKNLAEKNIIQYKTDRTNLDYLMQLHSTKYYQDFFRITRNYEYSWYGQFDVDAEKYTRIKNEFDRFDPSIRY